MRGTYLLRRLVCAPPCALGCRREPERADDRARLKAPVRAISAPLVGVESAGTGAGDVQHLFAVGLVVDLGDAESRVGEHA